MGDLDGDGRDDPILNNYDNAYSDNISFDVGSPSGVTATWGRATDQVVTRPYPGTGT